MVITTCSPFYRSNCCKAPLGYCKMGIVCAKCEEPLGDSRSWYLLLGQDEWTEIVKIMAQ